MLKSIFKFQTLIPNAHWNVNVNVNMNTNICIVFKFAASKNNYFYSSSMGFAWYHQIYEGADIE